MSSDGLYKRPDSPYWWASIRNAKGQRERVSTGCRDRKAARLRAAELERQAADPNRAPTNTPTLSSYLGRLIVHLKVVRKRAEGTLEMHTKKAGHLKRVFGIDTPIIDVDAAAVDRYIAARTEEGASQNTISKELTTLRGALKLARRDRVYPFELDQVLPVGFTPEYVPRETYLTHDQAQRLLEELHRRSPMRAAHVAWILATGARWSESLRARRADLRLVEGLVFVAGSKTEKARTTGWLPIVGRGQELLEYVLEVVGPASGPHEADRPVFRSWTNVNRDLPAACRAARVPEVTPNDLRRTTATWLRQAGASPDAIGEFLRHVDSRMASRVYAKMTPLALGEILRRQTGEAAPAGAEVVAAEQGPKVVTMRPTTQKRAAG